MAIWCVGHQPLAAHTPAAQWRHVCLDPWFIQEDQARRVNAGLVAHPLRSPAHQLGLELLGRQNGFFKTLALAMQEVTDARRVDDETTFSQCRRQLMKRHVGISLDLAQDESTMLPSIR